MGYKTEDDARREEARQECRERDELEALNRKTEENLAHMHHLVQEQEKKAEEARKNQERKFKAILDLVALIFLSLVAIAALFVLAYTEAIAWWIAVALTGGLMMICTFRTGWLWYAIKN